MRIDLPPCGFKNCKWQGDGNCLHESKHEECEYVKMYKLISSMIRAFHLCFLCQRSSCGESDPCNPIWNGQSCGMKLHDVSEDWTAPAWITYYEVL